MSWLLGEQSLGSVLILCWAERVLNILLKGLANVVIKSERQLVIEAIFLLAGVWLHFFGTAHRLPSIHLLDKEDLDVRLDLGRSSLVPRGSLGSLARERLHLLLQLTVKRKFVKLRMIGVSDRLQVGEIDLANRKLAILLHLQQLLVSHLAIGGSFAGLCCSCPAQLLQCRRRSNIEASHTHLLQTEHLPEELCPRDGCRRSRQVT